MLKTKRQILARVYLLQTTLPSNSVKLRLKISLPLSLHSWSSVQQSTIYIAHYIREISRF